MPTTVEQKSASVQAKIDASRAASKGRDVAKKIATSQESAADRQLTPQRKKEKEAAERANRAATRRLEKSASGRKQQNIDVIQQARESARAKGQNQKVQELESLLSKRQGELSDIQSSGGIQEQQRQQELAARRGETKELQQQISSGVSRRTGVVGGKFTAGETAIKEKQKQLDDLNKGRPEASKPPEGGFETREEELQFQLAEEQKQRQFAEDKAQGRGEELATVAGQVADFGQRLNDFKQANLQAINAINSQIQGLGDSVANSAAELQGQGINPNISDPATQQKLADAWRQGGTTEEMNSRIQGILANSASTQESAPNTVSNVAPPSIGGGLSQVDPTQESVLATPANEIRVEESMFYSSPSIQYDSILDTLNNMGSDGSDFTSADIALLKLDQTQQFLGASSQRLNDHFTQRKISIINQMQDYTAFWEEKRESGTSRIEGAEKRALRQNQLQEQRILADRESTMADLDDKSTRYESFVKAQMAVAGIPLAGQAGVTMLMNSMSDWYRMVDTTRGGFDADLSDLHNQAINIVEGYTDKVMEFNDSIDVKQMDTLDKMTTQWQDIEDKILLNENQVEMQQLQALGGYYDFLSKQKADEEAFMRTAYKEQQDNMWEQQKWWTENTGFMMGVTDAGEPYALIGDDGQPIETLKRSDQDFDKWYKQSTIAIDQAYKGGMLSKYERDNAIAQAKLNVDTFKIVQDTLPWYEQGDNWMDNLGQITAYGSSKWAAGLDIDGYVGQPLTTPVYGEVTSVVTGKQPQDGSGFGNQVKVKTTDGYELQFSHLDQVDVKPGDMLTPSKLLGTIGNTGSVIPGAGGDGSHLDLTIRDPQGKLLTAQEVEQYVRGVGKETTGSKNKGIALTPEFHDSLNFVKSQDQNMTVGALLENIDSPVLRAKANSILSQLADRRIGEVNPVMIADAMVDTPQTALRTGIVNKAQKIVDKFNNAAPFMKQGIDEANRAYQLALGADFASVSIEEQDELIAEADTERNNALDRFFQAKDASTARAMLADKASADREINFISVVQSVDTAADFLLQNLDEGVGKAELNELGQSYLKEGLVTEEFITEVNSEIVRKLDARRSPVVRKLREIGARPGPTQFLTNFAQEEARRRRIRIGKTKDFFEREEFLASR